MTGLRTIGDSWAGAGDHKGHTITAIEWWPGRVEHIEGDTYLWSSGRVRCTCGVEWETSIWPPALIHVQAGPGQAICEIAMPGEHLTRVAAEVTCPDCISWAHA